MSVQYCLSFFRQVPQPVLFDLTPSSSQIAVAMATLIQSQHWSHSCALLQRERALDSFTRSLRDVTSAKNLDTSFLASVSSADSLSALQRKLRAVRRTRCRVVIVHAEGDLSRRIFELLQLDGNSRNDVIWLLSDLVTRHDTHNIPFPTGALLFRLDVTSDVTAIAHALGSEVGRTLRAALQSHSATFAETTFKRNCFKVDSETASSDDPQHR